ncbi:MAG: radical SAM family heme chaperone HemW [Chitinophagaceae bacterium]|nr:radical SAM family heme chaperone HemW [Chitinophagaceae bacterium]
MAGIYIHIPFCRQACHYCNFHFATSLHYIEDLMKALLKEITLQKGFLVDETVETIYFGGGTPSLLSIEDLHAILSTLNKNFKVTDDAEITFEANPDDITEEKLVEWKKAGVTRLSIGVQSFFEEDLKWMNRAHNAGQAILSLHLAIKYFDNITIDLIYGLPDLTNEKWKHNVDTAISLGIPHLSCYALTVEPKTPLDKMIKLNKSKDVNPDKQSEQFLLLMEWLAEAGYEHYEISNFAKPEFRSRHNSSYWQGKKYLGLGPSAHSFNGKERQWNISNNNAYINSINENKMPAEKEILTETQRVNEYIMTSLRTMEGLKFEHIQFTEVMTKVELLKKSQRFINSGLLSFQNDTLILTIEGKLLADGIASDLFF